MIGDLPLVIISGSSRGIGKAIAEILLQANFAVLGLSRSSAKIDHPHFQEYAIDFADLRSLPKLLTELTKKHPSPYGIVCNAGKGLFGNLENFSMPCIEKLMNLNFTSQAMLVRSFLPHMKAKKQGRLLFIASESALSAHKQASIYCASKFALRGFALAMRQECAPCHIPVTIVNPGLVKTAFFDPLHFTHGPNSNNYCTPEDIAKACLNIFVSSSDIVFEEVTIRPLNNCIVPKK